MYLPFFLPVSFSLRLNFFFDLVRSCRQVISSSRESCHFESTSATTRTINVKFSPSEVRFLFAVFEDSVFCLPAERMMLFVTPNKKEVQNILNSYYKNEEYILPAIRAIFPSSIHKIVLRYQFLDTTLIHHLPLHLF